MLPFFLSWLLILSWPTSLTAGFDQPLWHIARASSSLMLPNTVLTRSQLGMAESGFEPTTLWMDIKNSRSVCFENRTQSIGCNFRAMKISVNGIHATYACTAHVALTHVLRQLHTVETGKILCAYALYLVWL